MTYALPLIDKVDGFEAVRDAIAVLLATEMEAQKTLATAAGKDPDLWAFDVYRERAAPWEMFRDGASGQTPIVNVHYESSQYDLRSSNLLTRQQTRPSIFYLDVYASAVSEETEGGHSSGDETASVTLHRIVRLVRNIVMHDKYSSLGLDSTLVSKRWIEGITAFQPPLTGPPAFDVAASRVILAVDHLETIDLADHATLSVVNVKFYYETGGKLIAECQYE